MLEVPGGRGEPISVSSVPFREISLCTNTSIDSLFNARKNAEIDRRDFELYSFYAGGTRRRGRTYPGEFCAVSGDLFMH
jgi:hypothetical protein